MRDSIWSSILGTIRGFFGRGCRGVRIDRRKYEDEWCNRMGRLRIGASGAVTGNGTAAFLICGLLVNSLS